MEDLLSAAARFVNTTSGHIFLTGKAGTGKTTFLKNLSKLTHKSLIIVAPTGIAALNAGGVTIHSQFLLPPMTFLPDRSLAESITEDGRFMNQNTLARKHPLNSARRQVLRSIDLLVIDEVSMLRADLLDAIDYRMRAARGNFKQSFGGIQVLFIGDLYQLPPVVKNDQWETLSRYYRSPWFYEAKALEEDTPVYIELDKIFRQSDPTFITILNNLRNNITTPEDIAVLNQHYKTPEEISKLREIITLTTHNYKADELNQKELRALDSASHFFGASIEDEFPESMYPVPLSIELKIGTQIMFVRNDNESKMYFNGKLATVIEIDGDKVFVEMAGNHTRFQLKRERWENKKYKVNDDAQDLQEDVIGAFEQYPVRLAWAITVHKSQGLTFDKAIIDVGQAFADGQVYVALSRLRSLEGLVLRTRIQSSVISTDKQIVAFVQSNHRPHQLSEEMKVRQERFVRQVIYRTFDFSDLIKDIKYVQKDHDEAGFEEGTMKPALSQIIAALEVEQGNTERFRNQLTDLLNAKDLPALIERIKKGSAYYRALLFQNIKTLLHHLEVVKLGKRVKTYTTQLTDLDQVLSKKLEEIDKAASLTEAILNSHEKFDFNELALKRGEERTILLSEIRSLADAEVPAGKKKKKARKPKAKDEKRSTFEITLDLMNSGMTVEQIAQERGLVVSTIETHLAKGVAEGTVSIFKFMTEETVMKIVAAQRELPEGSTSKDLYEKLKGKFGYGQLRAVMAYAKTIE
ncbi:MAG: AAA family ATPase [Cyclobacteriaceae bacterium]|nr:AAA family ATPase [Cyclobacteriaceae bacterium]